jgi:hypothetical protein
MCTTARAKNPRPAARSHVHRRLPPPAPSDRVHRPAGLLAGEHELLLVLEAEPLAADGEAGAAGGVHEHDLVAALGRAALDAVGKVAPGVDLRLTVSVVGASSARWATALACRGTI